jgi:chaperone required for assembly of F1-ATPase
VIALALAAGRLDAEAAFQAAHLDELHQMEEWGEDAEAAERLARIRADVAAAAAFLRLAAV